MLSLGKVVGLRGLMPFLALTCACLLWGTADVAAKMALDSIPPICLTALRFLVAALVLWPINRRISHQRIPVREVLPLAMIGITGMFLLQNFGLTRIAASNASLLQGSLPAITLIVAAVMIGERIGLRRGIGIGIAVIGVIVMGSSNGLGLGTLRLGDGLVLASLTAFGIFVVLSRETFRQYGTIPTVSAITLWGSATLVPAAALEVAVVRPAMPDLDALLAVLYLGIGCSAVAYILWGFALPRMAIGCVAAFDALIPVAGCIAAMVVLGEELTRGNILGGGAVIAALILIVCESEPATVESGVEAVEAPIGPVFVSAGRTA